MEDSVHAQIAFGSDDFAENPEPRCPVVLLLDTSGSMGGEPIQQLNRGLIALKEELNADALAAKRVEIATVTFGPVRIAHDFVGASAYVPPTLSAGGDTPMGGAILQGLELLRQRKAIYEVNGIAFYRPWVFLMTDGAPTDSTDEAGMMIRVGEAGKSFSMFAVGIAGAKMDVLAQLSPARPALQMDGLRFRDLFVWLSNSMRSISQSTPGTSVPLANPTATGGWASVGS